MNKAISNILIKSAISFGLAISAIIPSFIGIILCGTIISVLFNPPQQHEHNYFACKCDEAPLLTEPQATTVGVAFFMVLVVVLFFITRYLKFTKWEQITAFLIFASINYGIYSTAVEILHTQVSG